nr:unnamed protein product [Callosobruchus chinensis]
MTRLMQWNARSAVANRNSLVHFLHEDNIDIALISETWFKPSSDVLFRGYSIIRSDRFDGRAGVAIFVKHGLQFKELQFSDHPITDILICGILLQYNNLSVSIISLYKPKNVESNLTDWESIYHFFI